MIDVMKIQDVLMAPLLLMVKTCIGEIFTQVVLKGKREDAVIVKDMK